MAKAKAGSLASLRNQAKRLKIAGRSSMNKAQLQAAVDRAKASSMKFPARKKKKLAPTRQSGSSNAVYDRRRKALPPGKRVSNTGNVYYERRKNRSDRPGQLLGDYNGWSNYATWWVNLHFFDGVTADDMGFSQWEDVKDYVEDFVDMSTDDDILKSMASNFLMDCNWYEIFEHLAEE
tara:strand:- start:1622 stop:2155 length:534 start_codon:yes stop_codon:yes gene_type:complete